MSTDAAFEVRYGLLEEGLDPPSAMAAANAIEKIAKNLAAERCVTNFGMVLEAEHSSCAMADGREGAGVSRRQRHEALIRQLNLVTVAHPDEGHLRNDSEPRIRCNNS